MICDLGSDFIGARPEIFGIPEVVLRKWIGTVFLFKKAALEGETCTVAYIKDMSLTIANVIYLLPSPLQTPAQKASTNFPSFSSNSGFICVNGTFLIARSCVTGALFGLYRAKNVELNR